MNNPQNFQTPIKIPINIKNVVHFKTRRISNYKNHN